MRILKEGSRVDEQLEDDNVADILRKSLSVRLKDLRVSDYNGWLVGVFPSGDDEEGTLIYVPNVSPEELIKG